MCVMSSALSVKPFPVGTGFARMQTQLISCPVKPEQTTATPRQTSRAGEHLSCPSHAASGWIGAGDSGILIMG